MKLISDIVLLRCRAVREELSFSVIAVPSVCNLKQEACFVLLGSKCLYRSANRYLLLPLSTIAKGESPAC